jgi:choline-glycine betaine transporter
MIFAAGATNSILSYAVKEPLWHQSGHFFAQAGYHSQDELDMFAINMTVTDWGFGCWAAYTVVAVAMSLAVYRFKLPMTFRSCFYPIFGQYTWGWIGDVIDGFIIVAIMANIVTSLGFAAQNVVAGLIHIKWIESDISAEQVTSIQNTIVWVLSIVSLVSVVSGLYGGIRLFCIAAMGLSSFLLFFAFTMEDTKYLVRISPSSYHLIDNV